MTTFSLRSLLLAAIFLCNCITWTASRHHYTYNVNGHRSRHRRQGAGLFLSSSHVLPGGEGSGWGEWGQVSPCSRTCGGGVASQKRICLQVGPDGQPQCSGGDTKYFSCQTQDCPAGSKDFRAEQCAEFDDQLFRDIKYSWVPYTQTPNPCELNCMPRTERFYYRHKEMVVDGTRCNDDSFDVCVQGICQPVGCDMMLGSNAREDKCRECRGNNANCHTTNGILDTQDLRKGYNDILLVPEGATNVVIAEIAPSNNYLALRAKNGTFYLNGDYHIDFPRNLNIGGCQWTYERSQQGFAAPDKLRTLGPTNEPLYLSFLLQDVNVGIEYEYSLPTDKAPPQNKRYNWVHEKFTPCSASCGGGFQTRNVTCRSREELEVVDESLCDEGLRPPNNQSCNTKPCAPQWAPGAWGQCSKHCGKGGTRSREVSCQKIISNGYPSIVADAECFDLLGPKPKLHDNCNENATCPIWFTGPWKPCDKLCDQGKQTRQVVCYQKNGRKVEVLAEDQCEDERPPTEQPCMLQPCEGVDWVVSPWTGCDSCLSTIRTRTAVCATKSQEVVDEKYCAYHPTPSIEESCDRNLLPPCQVQWYATQWSNCSTKCGNGVRTRKVFCGVFDGALVRSVEDRRCDGQPKYNESRPCEVPKEKCPSQYYAGPWTACNKKCGGQQYRRVMCLRGEERATDCSPDDDVPVNQQDCNTGPCNEDELLPVDSTAASVVDDYEDCEDEELYPEAGLEEDADEKLDSGITPLDMMFSDSSSSDFGSGWSTYEPESNFTDDSTLTTDGLFSASSTGSTETLYTDDSGETETESSILTDFTDDTDSTISSSSSSLEETGSTEVEGSTESSGSSTEPSGSSTESSSFSSDLDTASTEPSGSTTELSGSSTEPSGSTTELDTSATEPSGSSTELDASSTEPSGSTTEQTISSDESSGTTESSTVITDISTTDGSTTGSADTSETELSTTEAVSTTESTESDGTTESGLTDETTLAGSTDPSETGSTETSDTASTEPTETGSTESTETGSTEPTETGSTESTESGSTESTEPKETGSTEPTETGSTEPTETESTDTTETGSTEYTETESTETTATGSTELTETGSTETTETGSTEPTETGSTETTETGLTKPTETGLTEPTETGSTETTETGSTEPTETSETGSTTESSSTVSETEISSESSTTESEGLTSSAVEWITSKKPRMCRPRLCAHTEFGCCPDKKSIAGGPFDEGCNEPKQTCKQTKHGCCPDGVSPAKGPENKGCPVPPCKETLFGCCESDNKTPAEGNEQEGCPLPPPPCKSSKYGCCKDQETEATGPGKAGCPETTVPETEKPSTSTAAYEGCEKSAFGCCYDNVTEAAGADQQGCPCRATKFGCCLDGVSTAQGPEFEGCVKSCNTSAYGCCSDGKSPAHGPNQEGCCLRSAFGCCPDNYNYARGPHLEGCRCQASPYGCCPDNVTSASGHDNRGCGCSYSPNGCCPDGHTEASGPAFAGCQCNTYQFGCCPDGVTIARGPGGQGCHCLQSEYKCCGDGETHATGPNQQGCDCSASKYGCCPDGQTEATGPKFQGCTDVPENKQAACSLKFDSGPCRNNTLYWYYDTQYGGCSRFWYGGCEGNGNKFASKEECEDTCVNPGPKDVCKLPQIKGGCASYYVRWYYDSEREACSNFAYGGCLGNSNNFETREACQKHCEPEKSSDQCSLPVERGSCNGNFPRWGFNHESKRCEEFVWGGCEGNPNRFSTEAACNHRCNPPGQPKPECSQPQAVGDCAETEAVWSFSQSEDRCVPFYYTGCGGNDNRFSSREACEASCPSTYVPDKCSIPYETGNCANYREKWYFDTKDQRCRQFYYGGCGGNANKFETEQQCQRECQPIATATAVRPTAPTQQQANPQQPGRQDFCFLEIDAGPCTQFKAAWAYDSKTGRCTSFQYGGCGGNRNNFPDEQYCQFYCNASQDICQLPMLSGPCEDSQMRWFYDQTSDSCSQFAYGGCEGNDNRFESRAECENRCKTGPSATTVATTTTTVAVDSECSITASLEPCVPERSGQVWYLNPSTAACESHDNPASGEGCRTTGVFQSQEGCERACGAFKGLDVCKYAVEPGACSNFAPKYFFNASSGRCEEFSYGGCLGSPNRFSSELECEELCRPTVDSVCTAQPSSGNCLARYELWYYDAARDQCAQFIYGGCGGNENRFETREACEGRCKKQTDVTTTARPAQQPECQSPPSLSPCGGNETVFYYDDRTQSCRAAPIGGCRHANSYPSEEECERTCGAFLGLDVCRAQVDPGPCRKAIPKFYFDSAIGSCQEFTYGGCQGGPNRFSTLDECEDICKEAGPESACLRPVDVGEPCGLPTRRWHYSPARAGCLVFAYQGCGGNENNFVSYQDCVDLCGTQRPGDEEQAALCNQYAEECDTLQTTCKHSIKVVVAAEGCRRCSCEDANCESEKTECEQIRCSYGIERVTGNNGCERCSCAADPCASARCAADQRCEASAYRDPTTQNVQYEARCVLDTDTNEVLPSCDQYEEQRRCSALRCPYGIEHTRGGDGCKRCECANDPCTNKQCPLGQRCVLTAYREAVSQETRHLAECRSVEKPGACPVDNSLSSDSDCSSECDNDADCRGVGKCCAAGCGRRCAAPEESTPAPAPRHVTSRPDAPLAPQASEEAPGEVQVSEGGRATLRCLFHGNPPPRITWRFGEITIDGDHDRYRLLSDGALEIVSLYRNDSGVYICIGENELGSARQEVRLQVNDPVEGPAMIVGERSAVLVGELDRPLDVRCRAYGFPEPATYWYRGINGPMVPYSNNLYEARGTILTIKRLTVETLGDYACYAYNGHGKPATWVVTVQAYQPDDNAIGGKYLLPNRLVEVTPREPAAPPPTTTQRPAIYTPQYTVEVLTKLAPASTTITAGTELSLPCEVDGYPEPEVSWTKDSVQLAPSDRIWITNTRLTIQRTATSDSGIYGCHASNRYSTHSSTVQINVQDIVVPSKCTDSPYFANCALIVSGKFCRHNYYSRFCCKSCVEAGQLDPREAEMLSDQPYRRK